MDRDKKISYNEFLALWDQKGDAKMKQDQDDVKKRRHRRSDSAMSAASSLDFSDDAFDALGVEHNFAFEADEIVKMLEVPDTPVSGDKTISAVNAFVLEKERSTRDMSSGRHSFADRVFVQSPEGRAARNGKSPQ